MKNIAKYLCIAGLLGALCGCRNSQPEEVLTWKPEGKVLIVCYSESGNQNTLTVANWIQELTGGSLHQIKMKTPYSKDYRDVLKESKHHIDNKISPEILPFGEDVKDYDIIFIGSPVWYGTFAPPMGTFLKQHDFFGKTVIPFCTHGGGGAGKLYDDLKTAIPGAKILPGLTVKGSNIVERTIGRGTKSKASKDEVIRHLNNIK